MPFLSASELNEHKQFQLKSELMHAVKIHIYRMFPANVLMKP